MPKFKFTLDPVLKQRTLLERRQQIAVAHLEQARLRAEAEVRRLQSAMSVGREAQRRLVAGTEGAEASSTSGRPESGRDAGSGGAVGVPVRVPVEQVRLAATASMHALVSLQRAALALAGAHQRLEAGQERLRTARVARKGVEVLKQRRFDAWRAEQARREDLALDDLVIMRPPALLTQPAPAASAPSREPMTE